MSLRRSVIISYSPASHTACLKMRDSEKAYLEDIKVARHLTSDILIAGRHAVVLFWNDHHPAEAVVIAVYD